MNEESEERRSKEGHLVGIPYLEGILGVVRDLREYVYVHDVCARLLGSSPMSIARIGQSGFVGFARE